MDKKQLLDDDELDSVTGGTVAQTNEIKRILLSKGLWDGKGSYTDALNKVAQDNWWVGRRRAEGVNVNESASGDNTYRIYRASGAAGTSTSYNDLVNLLNQL